MPSDYRVYVIENSTGKLYIGLSADVHRRVDQHNAGASKWTKNKGPWRLIWTSEAVSLAAARKLENRLKRQKGGDGLKSLMETYKGS